MVRKGGDKVLYLECKVFTWSLRVQGGDKEVKEASKAVTRHLVASKEFIKFVTSLSYASTRSQLLVPIHSSTSSSLESRHILGNTIAPTEDFADTPRQDKFYVSMSVDPSVANEIYQPDWELTNNFIMDKGPLCQSFVDHLATPSCNN
ncbi:hypothetical protein Tco_0636224 [Tanacetum coccineum]